jgi:ectoine hydroxylase-related dioxygenase (phytanoyl-CoA dioxygenase family)
MPTADLLSERVQAAPGQRPVPIAIAPPSGSGPELTEEQRASFRRDGYLVLRDLSTEEELATLRVLYDRLFSERRGWKEGNLFDMVGLDDLERGLALPQMLWPSCYEPALKQTRLYANALHIAQQLLGMKAENILEHAIMKPPGAPAPTPWHQDDAFVRRGCGFEESISIWMPLQDVVVENGCMQYIRYSNHGPLFPHRSPRNDPRIHGLETVDVPDLTNCVAVPLPAGGAVVHHSRTLHGSGGNGSSQPRRAYVLGYAVQSKAHKRFTSDYPWNVEKMTARQDREYQSLPPVKRFWRRIQRRMRGYS